MKRFVAAALALLMVFAGGWAGMMYFGLYIDLNPDQPPEAAFRACERTLQRRTADGGYEDVRLRAVEMSASLPGHPASDFAADREDYLRWMAQIADMGANAIQVSRVMDDAFYNALLEHNSSHGEPLYLVQGLSVADDVNYGAEDAYSEEFRGRLKEDGRIAVDVIHGRRNIDVARYGATGHYRADVSPWTLGYIVGYGWSDDTVAYTDHAVTGGGYSGRYLSTVAGASRFEALLAEVMDDIVRYESDKYKQQRLIAFANDPSNDPFEYATGYARQLPKFSRIDAEHILQSDYSGFFAAYRLYGFCEAPLTRFSDAQVAALGDLLDQVDPNGVYEGYLQLLSLYHRMPVYIMGYGFSTARGAVDEDEPPMSEQGQGASLVRVWRAACEYGVSGVCISSWQDAWERRTWNTAFATELTRNPWWHDLQSGGQNYGLMAFVPGADAATCLLDGDASEWAEADVCLTSGDDVLSLRYDAEALYLMVRGEGLSERKLYLPIDLSEELGSARCDLPGLAFERPADFVVCLEGTGGGRLLVQRRYSATLANFGQEMGGDNPFYQPPEADAPDFQLSNMAVERKKLIPDAQRRLMSAEELRQARAMGSWDTGVLACGNGNPASPDYDSRTDVCYGTDCVEVRIPWLLLNVADPSRMRIHRDYYDYYGVQTQSANRLWIGLGTDDARQIAMQSVALRGWKDQLRWHERLKASYPIVQAAWRGAAQ